MNKNNLGRVCKSCGNFKNWIDFGVKRGGIGGRDSRCKECQKLQKRAVRRLERGRRKKTIGGEDVTIKSVTVGKPFNKVLDTIAMIVAQSFINSKRS